MTPALPPPPGGEPPLLPPLPELQALPPPDKQQQHKPDQANASLNFSRVFIDRPIATAMLMVAIVLLGVGAYPYLPVSALPRVDYPTIQVSTSYPGASPDTMAY